MYLYLYFISEDVPVSHVFEAQLTQGRNFLCGLEAAFYLSVIGHMPMRKEQVRMFHSHLILCDFSKMDLLGPN
jgi:hypothetical protein